MKREELLRQLDETVDRLKEELEETTKQLQKFTAEESQRVPKWAKPTKVEDDKYFLANHWYHMEHPWKSETGKGWVWHSLTKTNENLVCQELNDWGFGVKEWDLCYDDTPPADKPKAPKWVKRVSMGDRRVLLGHWYKVLSATPGNCGMEVRAEDGNIWTSAFPVDTGYWLPCYDDNPPEEKKQDDPVEILRQRANKDWAATVPGYKIVYLRGDINSKDYVAILTDGTGVDNTFLLVGDHVMGNFKDGVSYLGCFDK